MPRILITKNIVNNTIVSCTTLALLTGSLLIQTPTIAQAQIVKAQNTSNFLTKRDPFLWPFTSNSIWNTPLGSNAQYSPAGFRNVLDFPNQAPVWRGGIGVDSEPIERTTNADPLVDVYQITNWRYRCNTTQSLNKKVRVPTGKIYKDPNGSYDTPNFSGVFVQPDNSLFHFNAIATCGNSKIAVYDYTNSENDSLFKSGHEGGHGGSGLSGIGGSIRKGELISNEPIKHAIKLNVLGSKYLTYNKDSTPGYVWPATKADSGAETVGGFNNYGGDNVNKFSYTEMGALTAIKPNITIDSLGIADPIAKKMFQAFQDYGGYIVDNTGWNHYDIPLELGVKNEVSKIGLSVGTTNENTPYFKDMMKIITNLSIVTNNTPNSIGGGGTPRMPLAPCMVGEVNCIDSNISSSSNSISKPSSSSSFFSSSKSSSSSSVFNSVSKNSSSTLVLNNSSNSVRSASSSKSSLSSSSVSTTKSSVNSTSSLSTTLITLPPVNSRICINNKTTFTMIKKESWNTGYVAIIKIKNTSNYPITNWNMSVKIPQNQSLANMWNIQNTNGSDNISVFSPNANWNKSIQPGQEMEVGGFIINSAGDTKFCM